MARTSWPGALVHYLADLRNEEQIADELATEYVERKVEQFVGGPVRDVLVVPVGEAPGDFEGLVEWVEGYVVG